LFSEHNCIEGALQGPKLDSKVNIIYSNFVKLTATLYRVILESVNVIELLSITERDPVKLLIVYLYIVCFALKHVLIK